VDTSSEAQAFLEGIVSLNASESHRVFEALTAQYYITLEVWYIRTSIDKVMISLMSNPLRLLCMTGTPPFTFGCLSVTRHDYYA